MPELPEVELARRSLARWLGGATLVEVHVTDPRILNPGQSDETLSRALANRQVQAIGRRGKWLRLQLDRGLCFSHLGMTGKWLLREEGQAVPRAASLELHARRDGAIRRIVYADPRRFGRFVLAREDLPVWSSLGPDPLLDGIDPRALHAALARRSSPIKVALLDQTLLAGIGNIQATEGLFFARLDPRRVASSLSRVEVGRLAKGLLRSIHATLASQSVSGDDALTYLSEGGDNPFAVYGREGTPCPRCRATLQKVVLAGRGTVLCAKCQGGGSFTVNRWGPTRTESAKGPRSEEPRWPPVKLETTGHALGAEREGPRKESFVVVVRDAKGAKTECDLERAHWAALPPEGKLQGDVAALTGKIDCASLKGP